ncbi:MAG: response regulator transcription factor [Wenzhouxiangella sp.]
MSFDRVLIIDDDQALTRMLVEYLEGDGWRVAAAHSGPAGLEAALAGDCDVVILDIMLPGMNGLEVLRALRSKSQVPVIMLTARGDDTDRIVGLELGADDYLPKPFNPRELSARLRAIARRIVARPPPENFEQVGLVIDKQRREVRIDGLVLDLTAAEFALFCALASEAGQVVSKDDLAIRALGRELQAMDRSIDTHVSRLRSKLPQSVRNRVEIRAVRGRGYVLTLGSD